MVTSVLQKVPEKLLKLKTQTNVLNKDQQYLIKTAFNWISLIQQHKIQGTRTNQQVTWNTLKAMNSAEEWREVTTVHTMLREVEVP